MSDEERENSHLLSDYKILPSPLEMPKKKEDKEIKSKNLGDLPNNLISTRIAALLDDKPTVLEGRKGNSLKRLKETSRHFSGLEGKRAMRRPETFFYADAYANSFSYPCTRSSEICCDLNDRVKKMICIGWCCDCCSCGITIVTTVFCALLGCVSGLLGATVGSVRDGIEEVKQCLREEPPEGYIDYSITQDIGSPPTQSMD